MADVLNEQQAPVVSYDPNKKYRWSQEDVFHLSGGEFGVVLNALRAVLGSPDAQRVLLASEANNIVENALARAVETGVVKEVVEQPQAE